MYLNGKLENSVNKSGNDLNTDRGPRIGNSYSGNYFFGFIDEVRVYDYARTPAQTAWEYNRGAPVAYYKMDECTGTTINDWGPNGNGGFNGNNGTITAGDTSGSNDSVGTCNSGASSPADEMWDEGTTGKRNASLDFDGTNDYVSILDDPNLKQESIMTWSFWIKRATTVDNTMSFFYGKGTSNNSL